MEGALQCLRSFLSWSVLALIAITSCAGTPSRPGVEQSAKQPQIVAMRSQKMLVVEATGDPDVLREAAFGVILRAYNEISERNHLPRVAPRMRWKLVPNTPTKECVAQYGVPVPDRITSIGMTYAVLDSAKRVFVHTALTTWEYGEVAQAIHVGPYEQRHRTQRELQDFIAQQGYTVGERYEEEYLKGPDKYAHTQVSPRDYVTVIRYNVKR
jgi:hypothetical protein